MADLIDAPSKHNLQQAAFHYFASHEGKNTSDTIGSIVKSALKRGMFKKEEEEIREADVTVDITRSEMKEKTEI